MSIPVPISSPVLPEEVLGWFRMLFGEINRELAAQLVNQPATYEPTLDQMFITQVQKHAAPIKLKTDWVVSMETHFIGGMKHWHDPFILSRKFWEVADIGLLVRIQQRGKTQRKKVALLQSKRLYPSVGDVPELEEEDIQRGIFRFIEEDANQVPLLSQRAYEFDTKSRYRAISDDDQVKAIELFMERRKIKVYYMLYNPWEVPMRIEHPLERWFEPKSDPSAGVRVLPAKSVLDLLRKETGAHLSYESVERHGVAQPHDYWRLEEFVADEFLACRQGTIYSATEELGGLIGRGYPISAVVSVKIEAPPDYPLAL